MLISCGFYAFSGAFSRSLGAILLAQLAGNHANRAEAPLVRSTSPVVRRCGRSVTRTFTGPLGARLRFTSELSRAEPMSSDRMRRHQYVAYGKHSVSGVTMHSANLINELIAWASFSAKRIVRALAVCRRTSSIIVALCPRNHSSQVTLSKMRENFSWMAVNDNVNLACSHNCGRTPRFSGTQKGFPLGRTLVIRIASLSAALAISSSEGSSAASGIGGHQATVGSSGSLSSSVEAVSSSEEGHLLYLLHPRDLQNSWTQDQSGDSMCSRGPVATDAHRSSGYPVYRQAADPVYPREKRPCGLDVDEQVLGTHYRLHRSREVICTHQQHNHTSIPDQSSRGKTAGRQHMITCAGL